MASGPPRDRLLELLTATFGHTAFRPPQREVVEALLRGQDAAVVMPTGGGKSLCYALPAVARRGVAFVVSPLVALMHDQVAGLRARGVPAAAVWAGATDAARDAVYADLAADEPRLKLVYVTPEGIAQTERLQRALRGLAERGLLSLLAVDEAHCISELGHEFRPAYRQLGVLRQRFPGVPIVALTATATPAVLADVVSQLRIPAALCFARSFDRPNLAFAVRFKEALPSAVGDLVGRLRAAVQGPGGGKAIVYAHKREEVDSLAGAVSRAGVPAVGYHGGMADADRSAAQAAFTTGGMPVVVATLSFGMGVDIPNVRLVAHFTLPKSLEGYYQEAGRAGRDGGPAACVLYYSRADKDRLLFVTARDTAGATGTAGGAAGGGGAAATAGSGRGSSAAAAAPSRDPLAALHAVIEYCESVACRRSALLRHFGEKPPAGGCRAIAAAAQRQQQGASSTSSSAAAAPAAQVCDVCADADAVQRCLRRVQAASMGAAAGGGGGFKRSRGGADDVIDDELGGDDGHGGDDADSEATTARLHGEGGSAARRPGGSRKARREYTAADYDIYDEDDEGGDGRSSRYRGDRPRDLHGVAGVLRAPMHADSGSGGGLVRPPAAAAPAPHQPRQSASSVAVAAAAASGGDGGGRLVSSRTLLPPGSSASSSSGVTASVGALRAMAAAGRLPFTVGGVKHPPPPPPARLALQAKPAAKPGGGGAAAGGRGAGSSATGGGGGGGAGSGGGSSLASILAKYERLESAASAALHAPHQQHGGAGGSVGGAPALAVGNAAARLRERLAAHNDTLAVAGAVAAGATSGSMPPRRGGSAGGGARGGSSSTATNYGLYDDDAIDDAAGDGGDGR